MAGAFAAVTMVVLLGAWHTRTRRSPNWSISADGRFYIYLGYPMVALAVYWLVQSPTSTDWEWAFGNAWGLAAMTAFVLGFNALNGEPTKHQAVESVSELRIPPEGKVKARRRRDSARH